MKKVAMVGLFAIAVLFNETANAVTASSGAVVPGEWNKNFDTAKAFASKNDMPILAVWSRTGCHFCNLFDLVLESQEFKDWAAETGMVMIYLKASSDSDFLKARDWIRGQVTSFPFVRVYWEGKGSDIFSGRSNWYGGKAGDLIARIKNTIGDWKYAAEPDYCGGYFADTNAPYATPEAEAATKSVEVRLIREATVATNQVMTISVSDTKASGTVTVLWPKDVTNTTVTIDNFDTKWFKAGAKVSLALMDGDEKKSTLDIACVDLKNASANPKWIGESFGFGEWTMDIEEAKKKVKNTSGTAYTLVSVQGSLWCPDCANVDRNFLDLEDEKGNNRFAEWAKAKNIALVAVDIPNYTGPDVDDSASPSLLSRTAYQTTLARPAEYPKSGADAALTNKMWRSGIGYLTRKGVSDEAAAAVYARNHELASKNTDQGGFHRPEDGNANRTGVPIFVLLRKDGSVAARLTRLASVSPMAADRENFDNYIKRFEEMLWIADNNASEIGNNYPSKDSVPFKSNGGSESATLCNADAVDTFYLEGFGGNARQRVTVKGESDAQVMVSFLSTNSAGKATSLAKSDVGRLSDGITLEHSFTTAGDYFVQVEIANVKGGLNAITSEAFKVESPITSHFQSYTVSGEVVLIPQEDRATQRPPAGTDKVLMQLTKGERYRIGGMESCASLEPIDGAPDGFFVGTETKTAEIKLTRVDGEIAYQVWKPGVVGFVSTSRSVTESVCDDPKTLNGQPLKLRVSRTDGKSGHFKLAVTNNLELTTLWPDEKDIESGKNKRFELLTSELEWTDGDTEDKYVEVLIHAIDGIYYGNGDVVIDLALVEGDFGTELADGKIRFTLTVTEDDRQEPGRAMFTRVTPFEVGSRTVYVREGETGTVYATRIEASDGLVSVILSSSVSGVKFATENPRDVQVDENDDKLHFYWATHEIVEKPIFISGVPAGKTAKVRLLPYGDFKVVSASNAVTVVGVAADAPGFAVSETPVSLYRYVKASARVQLTGTKGTAITFAKVSGTLPAGLKVGYDAEANALRVSGVPTAKSGTYTAIYQVREKRAGKVVPGLVTKLVFTMVDPAQDSKEGTGPLNPSVAVSRTLKNVMLLDQGNRSLAGVLQLTISKAGKVSAKYTCAAGTVSFSSKCWDRVADDGSTLVADLTPSKPGYGLQVGAYADGTVALNGSDPARPGQLLEAESDGVVWSKNTPATAWKGYYTVVVKRDEEAMPDAGENAVIPTGNGYLTLKMNTTSACNSGTFTIAGMLPDGTKISGSSSLEMCEGKAYLPIFRRASSYLFSAVAGIARNAVVEENRRSVESPETCDAVWSHIEKEELKSSYRVRMTLHGGYFRPEDDLGKCCEKDFERRNLAFYADGSKLATVDVKASSVDVTPVADSFKLRLNNKTGVITGSFVIDGGKLVNYEGVVVNGWGEGCGCGIVEPGTVFLPFMSGSYYYSQRMGSATVKHGGAVKIDK